MKSRAALLLLLLVLPLAAANPKDGDTTEAPQFLFPGLFATVQTHRIFSDSKLFADAVPRAEPATIMRLYRQQQPGSDAALQAFVLEHFELPADINPAAALPERQTLPQHIDRLWNVLTRNTLAAPRFASLLTLPKPYVVPGGRFREMYYWDSYFTMLGLAQSGRADLIDDMTEDFASLIERFGHVPNGARTYYLSRSQPPFFFAMVALTNPQDPAAAFARYLPRLRQEYAYWMQGESALKRGTAHRRVVRLADGSLLNRYWDDEDAPRDESYAEDSELQKSCARQPGPLYRDIRAAAESGWDFSSRWLADGHSLATIETTKILPVDLNSLLFALESAIRDGCERSRDAACAREFKRRVAARRAGIDDYLWDPASGNYQDYRWTERRGTGRLSAAMVYPLFVGAASERQAGLVAAAIRKNLLEAGGLVTTPVSTGQQWDAPNGWAPLQWLAIAGLRRMHQPELAETIACRFMATVDQLFQRSGKLVEKYDVLDTEKRGGGGEYPLQDGFGWTNGVMRQLSALYPGC